MKLEGAIRDHPAQGFAWTWWWVSLSSLISLWFSHIRDECDPASSGAGQQSRVLPASHEYEPQAKLMRSETASKEGRHPVTEVCAGTYMVEEMS